MDCHYRFTIFPASFHKQKLLWNFYLSAFKSGHVVIQKESHPSLNLYPKEKKSGKKENAGNVYDKTNLSEP